MNALAAPTSATEVHAEPTFEMILSAVCSAYDLTPAELRLGTDEDTAGARDLFVWLCDQLKGAATLASASYVGMPMSGAYEAALSVDRQRAADPVIRTRTDELALTLHVEACVAEKLNIPRGADETPVAIARRAVTSDRQAGGIGIRQIQSLAAAYLAAQANDELLAQRDVIILQLQEEMLRERQEAGRALAAAKRHPLEEHLRAFVDAGLALDNASDRHRNAAANRFQIATSALQQVGEKHFNIERKLK